MSETAHKHLISRRETLRLIAKKQQEPPLDDGNDLYELKLKAEGIDTGAHRRRLAGES